MTEDTKRHFRLKCRDILDRLVRKFGYEVIVKLIPESDEVMHKRLKNIRKIQTRKKKLKEMEKGDADEEEEEFRVKATPKR